MRVFTLQAEGYIDPVSEFEYKHIMNYRETFPLVHDHNFYEFFLILEGSIKHHINSSTIDLQKGHMVFIRPTDFHSFSYLKGDCHFINLAILEKTIAELFTYLGKGFDSTPLLESEMPPTLLLTGKELNEVSAQFENLHILPVNDKLRLNIELRIILIHLFSRFFMHREQEDDGLPDWLNKVVAEMKQPENFKEGIKAIKEIACKSDEHISRCFKKYLKQTPTQFVNELKLNYAANQIRFSNKKIVDVAFDSGFENQSNFHRQFKQMFNYTPAEFRRSNQKDSVYDH